MHNDTKIFLSLNRNQIEQRWIVIWQIVPRLKQHEKNVQQN